MEQLWVWLKGITALVIILGFLETILPESPGIRGTAKLVFGLVLMAAILQPILSLVNIDWAASLSLENAASSFSRGTSIQGDWEAVAARLQAKGAAPVLRAVDESAARQLEALLLTIQGVEQVEISLSTDQGAVEAVDVRVRGQNITGDRIQRIVSQYLDLPEEHITVTMEAGGVEL